MDIVFSFTCQLLQTSKYQDYHYYSLVVLAEPWSQDHSYIGSMYWTTELHPWFIGTCLYLFLPKHFTVLTCDSADDWTGHFGASGLNIFLQNHHAIFLALTSRFLIMGRLCGVYIMQNGTWYLLIIPKINLEFIENVPSCCPLYCVSGQHCLHP